MNHLRLKVASYSRTKTIEELRDERARRLNLGAKKVLPYMFGGLGAGVGLIALPIPPKLRGHVSRYPLGALAGGGLGYLGGRVLERRGYFDDDYEDD